MLDLAKLFNPIADQTSIGLAVSGGPDSLALMILIKRWRDQTEHNPTVHVYALDHGLRANAAQECQTVCTLAGAFGFIGHALVWSGHKPKSGIQAAARAARYQIIGQKMAEDGVSILLTGHHANDQAETVLMRLAHGSGLAGLSGMRAFSTIGGVRLFRPLLDIEHQTLIEIVADAELEAVDDPSNVDPKFERAQWRQLQPQFDKVGLTAKNLIRFSDRMARANDALQKISDEAYKNLAVRDQFGGIKLCVNTLLNQPDEIALRVLMSTLSSTSGSDQTRNLSALENLLTSLKKNTFPDQSLAGCLLHRQQDWLHICREFSRIEEVQQRLAPQQVWKWDGRFMIENRSSDTLNIGAAGALSRADAEVFWGSNIDARMACVRAAPMITDQAGHLVALGCVSHQNTLLISLVG